MNYLAIDTSGQNLTIVIKNGEKIYSYFDKECGVKHSVLLMPQIEKLIKEANFDIVNADFLAVVVGAGSFTGIRIGVSTIKAMCFAYNLPALKITSFDVLAYNVIDKNEKVLSLIDAGHGGYYACGYKGKDIVFPACYLLEKDLQKITGEYDYVVGSKKDDIVKTEVSLLDGLVKAIDVKQNELTFDLDDVAPFYVRKSQAEEGRK